MWYIVSTLVLIRHLWQLKTVVFLHWCLVCALPLSVQFHSLLDQAKNTDQGKSLLHVGKIKRHHDTQHNDTQRNDIKQYVTQHKVLVFNTNHERHSARKALTITTLYTECRISLNVMLKVFGLSIIMQYVITPGVVTLSVMAPYKKLVQTFLNSCKEILNLHDFLGLCNKTNRDQYY